MYTYIYTGISFLAIPRIRDCYGRGKGKSEEEVDD